MQILGFTTAQTSVTMQVVVLWGINYGNGDVDHIRMSSTLSSTESRNAKFDRWTGLAT